MHKTEHKLLSDIEKHGWHVINVLEDTEGPGFAYSVGLYQVFHHPEILIFGLSLNTMHEIINVIGNNIKSGTKFLASERYNEIVEDYTVAFQVITKRHYDKYLGWAIWYYKHETFPVLQCFWPSKNGYFPWETEYPASLKTRQPILND